MTENLCKTCRIEEAETSEGICWTCDIVGGVDVLEEIGEYLEEFAK